MTPSTRDSPPLTLSAAVASTTTTAALLFCCSSSGKRKLFLELFSGRGLGRKSDKSAPAIASIAADVTDAWIVAAAAVEVAEGTVGGAVGRGGGTEAVVVLEVEGIAVEGAVMEAVRVVVVAGGAGRGGAVVGIVVAVVVVAFFICAACAIYRSKGKGTRVPTTDPEPDPTDPLE